MRRNEALDTPTFSYAAHGLAGLDIEHREADLRNVTGPTNRELVALSAWLSS